MAAFIGFIIIGGLAGLLFTSIAAVFVRPRPMLLAMSFLALTVFTCLVLDSRNELDRNRQQLAQHPLPVPDQAPDKGLDDLKLGVEESEDFAVTFMISGVVALAGLLSQSIRTLRAKRVLKSSIANHESPGPAPSKP